MPCVETGTFAVENWWCTVVGFGAVKPSTLFESYLMPMMYVPAELVLKLTVVTPFEVLMFALIFVHPELYAKLPAAWLKKLSTSQT
jgi:hypothetical protein